MNKKLFFSFAIGIFLLAVCFYFGKYGLGLVAITGPVAALKFSKKGITEENIFSFLSGKGSIFIVAGFGFIIFIALSIYSLFTCTANLF